MKHTNILKYGAIFMFGLFGTISCQDNLEVAPAAPLESNFFDNEFKIQAGIAAVYAKELDLRGPYIERGGPFMPALLLPSDDITFFDASSEFETFSGLNSTNERIGLIWKLRYQLIARANFMLEKISDPTIEALYVTENLKDNNKGELLFLRSYENFMLWDTFRKAPIQKERISGTGTNMYLEPSKDFEMLDFAIADLETAATLLPLNWPENQVGRITKDGAYGLLVKCYVERACYNNRNAEDYSKAIAAFTKISNNRKLVAQFGENFDYRTENNSESLFEVQATQKEGASNNAWLTNDSDGQNHNTGAYGGLFWNDDWYTYTAGTGGPTEKLVDVFELGDPRVSETMVNEGWGYFRGWKMVKYVNGDRGDAYSSWGANTYNNPRVIRLADVKLLAAEAYFATGNNTEALKQVNDIRERARFSTPDGSESPVPAALASINIDDIMKERFVELAGEEGIRWTDLRRWHAAGYINLGNWTAADFGFPSQYDPALFVFDVSKHVLFPIPQTEMDANPKMAASGNNLGY